MNRSFKIWLLILVLSVGSFQVANGAALKWIKVGSYQSKAIDSANQGESAPGRYFMYYYYDGFQYEQEHAIGWHVAVKNWTDPQGTLHNVKVNGAAHGTVDEDQNTMPVPDAEGITIKRYYRYEPPQITVDGMRVDDPFPLTGDYVAPEKIPGTADVMVESWVNMSMGLTLHQKVLGWNQKYHDDYLIYDWTFINTGNVDLDEEIELPDQVLDSLYFMRENFFEHNPGTRDEWVSSYGEYTTDTLRIMYNYPSRSRGTDYDNTGYVNLDNGFLRNPLFMGEAMLHVDTSPTDNTDDFDMPGMTGVQHIDWSWNKLEAYSNEPSQNEMVWKVARDGFEIWDGAPQMSGADVRPGHHSVRFDERGEKYAKDFTWFTWLPGTFTASGPWTLQPMDSIQVVMAKVIGSISPQEGWRIGNEWQDQTLTWDGPSKLMPPYVDHPDLMLNQYDEAKANWIFTGKDSLFTNTNAAQENVRAGYDVPAPPPAPSLSVTSAADKIMVEWTDFPENHNVPELPLAVGYRVYRAIGNPDPAIRDNQLIGEWEMVFECGEGTDNAITHTFEDREAQRGQAYYYYVSAFDDGVNNIDVTGRDLGRLESGKYLNRTTQPASLLRQPGATLDDIRVVPNPFNINAAELQYVGEPDKIIFMNVPPVCTIKIYTVRGDLVQVIEHTDGSGDQPWGVLDNEQMTTISDQIVVSGLYIAHIETPEGESTMVKFAIVR